MSIVHFLLFIFSLFSIVHCQLSFIHYSLLIVYQNLSFVNLTRLPIVLVHCSLFIVSWSHVTQLYALLCWSIGLSVGWSSFGQRPNEANDPCFYKWRNFSSSSSSFSSSSLFSYVPIPALRLKCLNLSLEGQTPTTRLKSQPQGSHTCYKAQILSPRAKSRPQGPNPSYKAQTRLRLKSKRRSPNPCLEAKITVSMAKP